MTASGQRGPMGARELVLLALLGALLLVTKLALAWLPNIEPVSLLVLVYTAVLGWKALAPVYVYVMMGILRLGAWLLEPLLYVWLVLVVLAMLFRKMESPLGWAVLSGAFGLSFGALCALVYWVTGGWAFALSWWVSGIPLDLLHCAGNFAMALVLFPALQTGADPSDAHVNEERRPIGRRSLFIACTPHTALGRRAGSPAQTSGPHIRPGGSR